MNEEWAIYNLFASSPEAIREVTNEIKSLAKMLVAEAIVQDFYYNLYYDFQNIPPKIPAHVRFGFYKLKDATMLEKKFNELKQKDKITKIESIQPDLANVDGVVMDKIKLTARKITDIIQEDFGTPTKHQTSYLIHLSMNPIFGYDNEREIYLFSTALAEHAIRKFAIVPKEKWLTFLDNLYPFLKQKEGAEADENQI